MKRLGPLVMLACVLPSLAFSAPAEKILELGPKDPPKFINIGVTGRVHVENPKVAAVELLPSGELLVEPKGAGETMVFVHGKHWVQAFRVLVGAKDAVPAEKSAAAKKACKSFSDSGGSIDASVDSDACVGALIDLTRHYSTRRVVLTYDHKGLAAVIARQKKALETANAALAKKVELSYVGMNLRIKGTLDTSDDFDTIVRVMWHHSPGKLLLDTDELTVEKWVAASTQQYEEVEAKVVKEAANDDDIGPAEESDVGEDDGMGAGDDVFGAVDVVGGYDESDDGAVSEDGNE